MSAIAKVNQSPLPIRPAANAPAKATTAPAIASDQLAIRTVAPKAPPKPGKWELFCRAASGLVAAIATTLAGSAVAYFVLKGVCAVVPPFRPIADTVLFASMFASLIPGFVAGAKTNKWMEEVFHPELKGRGMWQFLKDSVKTAR